VAGGFRGLQILKRRAIDQKCPCRRRTTLQAGVASFSRQILGNSETCLRICLGLLRATRVLEGDAIDGSSLAIVLNSERVLGFVVSCVWEF